jgi:large repetitive protein
VPRLVTVVAGDSGATITWTAPASAGSGVLGYRLTLTDRVTGKAIHETLPCAKKCPAGVEFSDTVTGLVNRHAYAVVVTAYNKAGPASAAAVDATPASPQIVAGKLKVTRTPAKAALTWTAPDPSTTVTSYVVRLIDESNADLVVSVHTVAVDKPLHVVSTLPAPGHSYRYDVAVVTKTATGAATSIEVPPPPPTNKLKHVHHASSLRSTGHNKVVGAAFFIPRNRD